MFFHVSSEEHNIGDVLSPGRWGELLRTVQFGRPPRDEGILRMYLCEMSLETARQAVAPQSPSRLNCIFVAETAEFAIAFRDRYRSEASIYRVEPAEKVLASHRGDFELISQGRTPAPYMDFMPAESIQYWTQPPIGLPEILYPGKLRVTGKLS